MKIIEFGVVCEMQELDTKGYLKFPTGGSAKGMPKNCVTSLPFGAVNCNYIFTFGNQRSKIS